MIRFFFCLCVGLEGNKVWPFLVAVSNQPAFTLRLRPQDERMLRELITTVLYREPRTEIELILNAVVPPRPFIWLQCSNTLYTCFVFLLLFILHYLALLLFVLLSSCGLGDSAPVLVDDVKRKWQSPYWLDSLENWPFGRRPGFHLPPFVLGCLKARASPQMAS